MRILNETNDEKIDKVLLILTVSEASELLSSLRDILRNPTNNHAHIPSEDYKKEITIAIYGADITNKFSDRINMLIKDDK